MRRHAHKNEKGPSKRTVASKHLFFRICISLWKLEAMMCMPSHPLHSRCNSPCIHNPAALPAEEALASGAATYSNSRLPDRRAWGRTQNRILSCNTPTPPLCPRQACKRGASAAPGDDQRSSGGPVFWGGEPWRLPFCGFWHVYRLPFSYIRIYIYIYIHI